MMIMFYLALILSIIGVHAAPAAQVVDLGYAKYSGIFNVTTGNTLFLGMRYAAPPIGKRAFTIPRLM